MNIVAALLVGALVAGAARWLIDAIGRLALAAGRERAAWLTHHTVAEPSALGVGFVAAVVAARAPTWVPLLIWLSVGLVVVALGVRGLASLVRWRRGRP